ncbi:MAG TPA: shikimate kinase [Candidatus Cloacimonetes bacterium]|nr:shikimate kinase [Candidatus Cloacimonadota bacterium]
MRIIMMIFLIGFMGSGKTWFGKKFASTKNLPFYDLDDEIEKKLGMNIHQIFQKYGKTYFRKIESEILLAWDKEGIIATGGGIVETEENRKFLQQKEIKTIWLNPSWKTIFERIKSSDRPLVRQLSKQELFELWQKRELLYRECADVVKV